MGAIIRNHEGMVLGTLRICRSFIGNAFTAENLSLFIVVKFCLATGYEDLIVESDSKILVDIIQG